MIARRTWWGISSRRCRIRSDATFQRLESLVIVADRALYEAKDAGRNQARLARTFRLNALPASA